MLPALSIQLQLTYQPDPEVMRRAASNKKKKEARKEIRRWLADLKKVGCQNPGCDEKRIATLDYHHLDQSTKEIEINEAIRMRWSKASIEREIAKCVLICSNCHRCEHENSFRTSKIVDGVNEAIYANAVVYARGIRM